MPRGQVIWIQAHALPTIPVANAVTVNFAARALPVFSDADKAQICAEEIVTLLSQHDVKAEIVSNVADDGSSGTSGNQPMIQGRNIWIQVHALPTMPPRSATYLSFAEKGAPVFADASAASRCAEALIAVLQRHGLNAVLQQG